MDSGSRPSKPNGKNHGFWNTSEEAEGFLDQMLTWREMGFNMAHREPDQATTSWNHFRSWAQKVTSPKPSRDERPVVYNAPAIRASRDSRRAVECGSAATRRNRRDAQLHENAVGQEDSALDGRRRQGSARDHDSPQQQVWLSMVATRIPTAVSSGCSVDMIERGGLKRPVFGSIRYMTSDSARKKLRLIVVPRYSEADSKDDVMRAKLASPQPTRSLLCLGHRPRARCASE